MSKNHPVSVDEREQLARHVGANGLEPALRVGKPRGKRRAQQEVVRPRNELALWPAHHPEERASRVPIATWEWPETSGATSGKQRRQVGRQVDVAIREHLGVRRGPHRVEGPTAPLRRRDATTLTCGNSEARRWQPRGAIRRRVVRDRHAPCERECSCRYAHKAWTEASRPAASLYTGITRSRTGPGAAAMPPGSGRGSGASEDAGPGARPVAASIAGALDVVVMPRVFGANLCAN